MPSHATKTQEHQGPQVTTSGHPTQSMGESTLAFIDTRPAAIAQLNLQEMAAKRPQVAQLVALQNLADNGRSVRQMKGKNWQKLADKVVGSKEKIAGELEQAGTDASIRDEASSETLRKRLTGGDWEDPRKYELVPEGGKFVKKAQLTEAGKKSDKPEKDWTSEEKERFYVKSRYQLSEEERGGLKNYKGTEGLSEAYQEMARTQLKKFDKSHAFISEWAFGNILTVWKRWGSDANFVSPLSEAEALFNLASKENGIATLENKLGVPEGNWSNKGATKTIYRFIVSNSQKFNLRLPSGAENQAYQNEWLSGGKTLGGDSEAVINAMSLDDLSQSVSNGAIEIYKITFHGKDNVEEIKVASI